LMKAGVSRIPCLFWDVDKSNEIGVLAGGTFPLSVLESNVPPTCAHFTPDRAYPVKLRVMDREIEVTWKETIRPRVG